MSRLDLIVEGPTYLSQGDERVFFEWLQSISCVDKVGGQGRQLHIRLKRLPGRLDLRELIAVLHRYHVDPRPLAALKTPRNSEWFAENKVAYWYAGIFGKPKKGSRKIA
jgi:hypothetical protein